MSVSYTASYPNSHAITLIDRLQSTYSKASDLISTQCRHKKSGKQLSAESLHKDFNKAELCLTLMTLIEHVWMFSECINDLAATLKDYKIINRTHEECTGKILQKFAEDIKIEIKKAIPQPTKNECTEKILKKFAEEIKTEITKVIPQPTKNECNDKILRKFANEVKTEIAKVKPQPSKNENTKKQTVPNEKHVLVINDLDKEDIKEDKSFSTVLKNNLSDKLKGIPVSKAKINHKGEAILMFPSPETCSQAKESLQTTYDVKNSDRKQPVIMPRIKIHNLDPHLSQNDKNELRNKILAKNEALKNATCDEFSITFIDKNQNFAIAKVDPDTHKRLTSNGRLYIELSSHKITDHFNPIQCFRCQSFNHTSNSPLCNSNGNLHESTCLYCSKNHKSSVCPSKISKKDHKCVNCLKSENFSIKNGAAGHTSTSKKCPIFIKEVERLKSNTCYNQQVFMDSLKWLKPVTHFDQNPLQRRPDSISNNPRPQTIEYFIEYC